MYNADIITPPLVSRVDLKTQNNPQNQSYCNYLLPNTHQRMLLLLLNNELRKSLIHHQLSDRGPSMRVPRPGVHFYSGGRQARNHAPTWKHSFAIYYRSIITLRRRVFCNDRPVPTNQRSTRTRATISRDDLHFLGDTTTGVRFVSYDGSRKRKETKMIHGTGQ